MTLFATSRVTTLDPLTGEWLGVCRGPQPDGRCSMGFGGRVACAGQRIVAEMTGDRRRIRLAVPAELDRCPLASPAPIVRARPGVVGRWFRLHSSPRAMAG